MRKCYARFLGEGRVARLKPYPPGERWKHPPRLFSALSRAHGGVISDFEYYAPGVGQVYTEELDANGDVVFATSLVSTENVSGFNISDRATADFV